ncbi:putative integrase [Legionella sainthelensi]|uniref:phage integrase N-terminal domain-containing protein n=1 Tax=Legionella sainthelensi TaxID=28087 RepID=UPI000F70EC3A|nr:phage integrase N-terminal domain-containing protein [Legionella sainthelensi]VEB35416.1 putative integrase [Legionella sainthelensi]
MRKKSLRQAANKYLITDNRGNFKERKRRIYVIHKMIDDLFIIGDTPLQWQAIKLDHIKKLLIHWQKRKIKMATIMRHMSIIRKFLYDLECPVALEISNQSLGLRRKNTLRQKSKIYPGFWQNIPNPSARLLLAFQVHFGLTLSEVMHLNSDLHLQEHSLWITREIASNSRDRFIPIRNDIQVTLLKEFNTLTEKNNTLIKAFGYQTLLHNYRQALNELKLLPIKNYRYLYARQLKQQLSPPLNKYELMWLIMEEMGVTSRSTVWNYLNE